MTSALRRSAWTLAALWALAPGAYAREVVDATGTSVKLVDVPSRVITLAPSLGELAGDILGEKLERIVGVSEYTDYPPTLAKKTSVGQYTRFNLEVVVSLKPDLVLATLDGNPKDQVTHLRELGVPVVVVAGGDFARVAQSMRLVADALGSSAEGARMASQFTEGVARIRSRAALRKGPGPKVMIQVGGDPLVVVGGKSFIHSALESVGGENVYADSSANYPRPSVEDVLSREPEAILVLALGKDVHPFEEMANFWKRFSRLKAVKSKRVKVLPGDSLARPTMRLMEGLALLEKAIHEN